MLSYFQLFNDKLVKDESVFGKRIVEKFPDLSDPLRFFQKAFNHNEARQNGKITPKKGVDEDYDRMSEEKSQLENDLEDYLREQKKFFKCSEVKYFGSGNNLYQLEIPEDKCRKAGDGYTMGSNQRKGKVISSNFMEVMFVKLTSLFHQ